MWGRRLSSVHPVCRSYQLGLVIMFDKRTKGCYVMGTFFSQLKKKSTVINVIYLFSIIQCTSLLKCLWYYTEKTWQSQYRFRSLVTYLWEMVATIHDSHTILLFILCNWGKQTTKFAKCFVVAKFVCSLEACNPRFEKFSKELSIKSLGLKPATYNV